MKNFENNVDDSEICFKQALIEIILESWRFLNAKKYVMLLM